MTGWFNSVKSPKLKNVKKSAVTATSTTPEGQWKKCEKCAEIVQIQKILENAQVCPYCDHHYRLRSADRIKLLLDEGSFSSFGDDLISMDPLKFIDKKEYCLRLEQAIKDTGMKDSTVCGLGKIDGRQVSLAVMDFSFMGGSMGVVTGEKVAYAMDMGLEQKIPVIVVSCSGGARMQEGILSLMQMAKTAGSRQRLKKQRIPYLSVLTDPTTGGCAASFAMLGDVILAEPRALVGFAGPRVIQQSIRQALPEGFQRSEFLYEHGQVDRIVHRRDLKKELSFLLDYLSPDHR